jgi:hypothetical protein
LGFAISQFNQTTTGGRSGVASSQVGSQDSSSGDTTSQNVHQNQAPSQSQTIQRHQIAQNNGAGPGPSRHSKIVDQRILLIVQNGFDHYLAQIVLEQMGTNQFFDKLKAEYFRLKGIPRRLLSVWRLSHCDFYKVSSENYPLVFNFSLDLIFCCYSARESTTTYITRSL